MHYSLLILDIAGTITCDNSKEKRKELLHEFVELIEKFRKYNKTERVIVSLFTSYFDKKYPLYYRRELENYFNDNIEFGEIFVDNRGFSDILKYVKRLKVTKKLVNVGIADDNLSRFDIDYFKKKLRIPSYGLIPNREYYFKDNLVSMSRKEGLEGTIECLRLYLAETSVNVLEAVYSEEQDVTRVEEEAKIAINIELLKKEEVKKQEELKNKLEKKKQESILSKDDNIIKGIKTEKKDIRHGEKKTVKKIKYKSSIFDFSLFKKEKPNKLKSWKSNKLSPKKLNKKVKMTKLIKDKKILFAIVVFAAYITNKIFKKLVGWKENKKLKEKLIGKPMIRRM